MKTFLQLAAGFVTFFLPICGFSQGFINLDFESAQVPNLPPGQSGGYIPISNAIPGWSAYLGNIPIGLILHNDLTLGTPSLSVLGPQYGGPLIIDGRYTVCLQAGRSLFDPPVYYDAALVQSGTVPADAMQIQIRANDAYAYGPFAGLYLSIGFAGQNIPLTPLSTNANYTVLFSGDVSSLAGQSGDLRITARHVGEIPATTLFVDSIAFSSVPEPTTVTLFVFGSVVFSWCATRQRK